MTRGSPWAAAMLEDLMSVETESVEKEAESLSEPEADERREAAGRRIPFDGLVEVGGALGPSFEAQAVDVSKEGIHLRTAYLPEVGQSLTCRFDAGGREVLAPGEVVWRHEESRGGEFAVRFGELDQESQDALAIAVDPRPACVPRDPGARVRLHIEGLDSPMRARVKGASHAELRVGSELGFLQVGKQLELEDASTGGKRPACIDKVEVEIDPASKIPQLVVTLRYSDTSPEEVTSAPALGSEPRPSSSGASPGASLKVEGTPEPTVIDDEAKGSSAEQLHSEASAPANMKSALARGAAKVTPAVMKFAKRAIVTFGLLAARARGADGSAVPTRRTTAPAPGGGLHASGRRVVRSHPALEAIAASPPFWQNKRVLALAAATACAVILVIFALRKPASPSASVPPVVDTAPPQGSVPPSVPATTAAATEPAFAAQPPPVASSDQEAKSPLSSSSGESDHGYSKPVHVTPFGNGSVAHGNLLRIKMDGAIEKIEGASTPTGFTVVIPNRRSLEAAAPLAARDVRIASMRVTNEAHGAELSVTFKDGVPNYQVRAKGDTLEIVLASAGRVLDSSSPRSPLKPVANKNTRLNHAH
jgi:hypothetical protein